jgi:hypothetical protein
MKASGYLHTSQEAGGHTAGLDVMGKKEISFSCRESNPYSSVIVA